MPKFRLRDRVRKIGEQEVRTVEEIREGAGEPTYSIQLGRDFATRIWAKESELEAAEAETGTSVMDTETGKIKNVKPGDFI